MTTWQDTHIPLPDPATDWNLPAEDSILRRVRLTNYTGPSNCGGITLWLKTPEDAEQLYLTLLSQHKNNPYRINRGAFRCVANDGVPPAEAMCISREDPCMLHIATIGRVAMEKLDGALFSLFGERLPRSIREKLKVVGEFVER